MVESGEVAATTAVALSREHGPKAGSVATAELAKAKASGKAKLTKSAAMKQFSAAKARRLVELLCDSGVMWQSGECYLTVREGTLHEIEAILADYREGIGGEVTES